MFKEKSKNYSETTLGSEANFPETMKLQFLGPLLRGQELLALAYRCSLFSHLMSSQNVPLFIYFPLV